MTQLELQELAQEFEDQLPSTSKNWDEGGGWRTVTDAYEAGFRKALEAVFQALDAPLYTHYDYDAALKPLLDLYDSLINKP